MKTIKRWLILLLLLCLAIIFCVVTGGKRSDVFLNNITATDNMETIVLDVGVASSIGYVRTLETNQKEDSLYVTFYSTYGFNSAIGAKNLFPINIEKDCDKIYFNRSGEEWKLVLQKDTTGTWESVK